MSLTGKGVPTPGEEKCIGNRQPEEPCLASRAPDSLDASSTSTPTPTLVPLASTVNIVTGNPPDSTLRALPYGSVSTGESRSPAMAHPGDALRVSGRSAHRQSLCSQGGTAIVPVGDGFVNFGDGDPGWPFSVTL